MATLKLTSLHCQRKQDVVGKDEPVILVDEVAVWKGTIGKGETQTLSQSVDFDDVATVVLQERDGEKDPKQIGASFTVHADARQNQVPLVFKTSGAHYELYYQVKQPAKTK
jgi:hypothetical protein